jgi:hypothetical protein
MNRKDLKRLIKEIVETAIGLDDNDYNLINSVAKKLNIKLDGLGKQGNITYFSGKTQDNSNIDGDYDVVKKTITIRFLS